MLDPRAVALLGFGYAAGLVARIGLWDAQPATTPPGAGGLVPLPLREPKRKRREEDEALLLAGAI